MPVSHKRGTSTHAVCHFTELCERCTEKMWSPAAHHRPTHAAHAETRFPPRQLMKNFEAEVSAPDMSSSVVTMPGDRLCSATLRMPCAKQGQGSTGRSLFQARIKPPSGMSEGPGITDSFDRRDWFLFAFSHPPGDAIRAQIQGGRKLDVRHNVGNSLILLCVHTPQSQRSA